MRGRMLTKADSQSLPRESAPVTPQSKLRGWRGLGLSPWNGGFPEQQNSFRISQKEKLGAATTVLILFTISDFSVVKSAPRFERS